MTIQNLNIIKNTSVVGMVIRFFVLMMTNTVSQSIYTEIKTLFMNSLKRYWKKWNGVRNIEEAFKETHETNKKG